MTRVGLCRRLGQYGGNRVVGQPGGLVRRDRIVAIGIARSEAGRRTSAIVRTGQAAAQIGRTRACELSGAPKLSSASKRRGRRLPPFRVGRPADRGSHQGFGHTGSYEMGGSRRMSVTGIGFTEAHHAEFRPIGGRETTDGHLPRCEGHPSGAQSSSPPGCLSSRLSP
jgi:hypothetical protein